MTKILNQNEALNVELIPEIFERADELLYQKIQENSQVLAGRLDFHGRDEDVQKVIQRLVEKEKRKGLNPSYLAVREVGKSGNNHYHTIFFLNGNKTRSVWPLFEDANNAMNNRLGEKTNKKSGLIDLCNHDFENGIMIRRNSKDKAAINELSKKVSYLAKKDQKENVKGKRFFSSQLKK